MRKGPVFQVGAQRSGTTLLRVMLNAHPLVSLGRLSTLERGLGYLNDAGEVTGDLSAYYEEAKHLHEASDRVVDIDRSLSFHDQLRSLFEQVADNDDKPVFCAGLHHHYHRLLTLYPDARFIYLYRDGRDVARSSISLGWHYNYWSAVAPWIEAEKKCKELRALLPPERWLEVRYEDLILDTDRVLKELCQFLGVNFDPAIHDYTKTSNYSEPDPSLVDQWRRKMSDAEVQQAEARIADQLIERGYELSGLPRLELSPQDIQRLEREGKWKLRYGRMMRVGPIDYLAEVATRKAGLKSLNSKVLKRMERRRRRKLL